MSHREIITADVVDVPEVGWYRVLRASGASSPALAATVKALPATGTPGFLPNGVAFESSPIWNPLYRGDVRVGPWNTIRVGTQGFILLEIGAKGEPIGPAERNTDLELVAYGAKQGSSGASSTDLPYFESSEYAEIEIIAVVSGAGCTATPHFYTSGRTSEGIVPSDDPGPVLNSGAAGQAVSVGLLVAASIQVAPLAQSMVSFATAGGAGARVLWSVYGRLR